MKQGEENFEVAKEPEAQKGNYIFQKNKKTKIAFYFIAVILILLIIAVAVSGAFV